MDGYIDVVRYRVASSLSRVDQVPELTLDELARIHVVRGPQLMWLLGAGASAAAGVATAGQMIDEFKQIIYGTVHNVPVAGLNMAERGVREKVQRFFDQAPGYPSAGDPDEYPQLFEAAWTSPSDRRAFIEKKVTQGRPGFGNIGLAALSALGRARIVWSTNFDRVHEQAAAIVLEPTAQLTVAALDTADIAVQALAQDRFPLYVKLHGDYQSERLKNTTDELRTQDERNRTALVQAAGRFGLLVTGYSGRDDSLLVALRAALDLPTPFPAGLYWCLRPGEDPWPRVSELLASARAAGVDARWVPVHTFDELIGSVLNTVTLPDRLAAVVDGVRPTRCRQPFTVPPRQGRWPQIGLNALPVPTFPLVCRQVDCATIGGTKAVREALSANGARAVGARRSNGVIAFGHDADLRRALKPFDIRNWSVGSIATDKLQRDASSDLGLLYDALAGALSRERPLHSRRGGGAQVLTIDPVRAADPVFTPLATALKRLASNRSRTPGDGQLVGSLGRDGPAWAEGVRLRLAYHYDTMWLVFEPLVWLDAEGQHSAEERERRAGFIGPRTWHRYNPVAAEVIAAWAGVLSGTVALFGLGEDDGIDATFTVGAHTAISARRNR